MKKLLLLFALFAVALSATASPTERWLDPECFAENRAPMRTSFIVFPTASEAVPENDYTRSPSTARSTANGPFCARNVRVRSQKDFSAPATTTRRGA